MHTHTLGDPQLPCSREAWDPHVRQAARTDMVLQGWGGGVKEARILWGFTWPLRG